MIGPVWADRRTALALAKAYKGTESTPTIPDEFRPFITSSLGRYMGQQAANPITNYNGNNAMDVEGMTPFQQLAMGYSAGNLQNSPFDVLAAQAAQRAAGMAGSGPTTGYYNTSGEMGLQDWAQAMEPFVGTGAELGNTAAPPGGFADKSAGANAPPQGPLPPNYGGGPPPVGGGGTGGGGGPVPGTQPGGGGAGGGGGMGINRTPGMASNAGRMPAGYTPRNSMSDEDFQSALAQYGIGNDILGQEHGAARANLMDALGVPAAQIQLINAGISQRHRDARQGTPDPNAMGYSGYVPKNPQPNTSGGGGGSTPAKRTPPTPAKPNRPPTREVRR